jgi:hypothetical protein
MNPITPIKVYKLEEALFYIKENYSTIKPFLCNYELESTKREFYIFRTVLDYMYYLNKLDLKDRRFNEVLTDNIKIFFDLDIKENIVEINKLTQRKIDKLLRIIIEQIKNTFLQLYNMDLLEDNILILKSDYINKYSYHIVINGYYVEKLEDVKFFVLHMIDEYFDNMPFIMDIIDTQIYSLNKSLRLVGNGKYKYKGKSLKYLINKNCSDLHSVLTYLKNCKKLQKIEKKEINIKIYNKVCIENILKFDFSDLLISMSKSNMVYKRINLEEELRICFTKLFHDYGLEIEGYGINDKKPQFISLQVATPWSCPICNREHDNSQPYIYTSRYGHNLMCYRAKGVIDPPDNKLELYSFAKKDKLVNIKKNSEEDKGIQTNISKEEESYQKDTEN